MTYKMDGNIYAISDDHAFVGCYVFESCTIHELDELRSALMAQVCKYYLKHNNQELIKLLSNHFTYASSLMVRTQYRPGWLTGVLEQRGTLVIRFERYKDDGLTVQEGAD